MIMKRVILIILISICLFGISNAKHTKQCKVKYKVEYGWSKTYTVDVTFLTGSELNSATGTYNYSSYSVYAVIFWAQNEATVIKIRNILLCGMKVTQSCIDGIIGDLQGYDQDDDYWNICTGDFCF